MRCPTCKQACSPEASAFRPFCSQRCKLLDLGRWLDGSYTIPGEPASEEDLDSALEDDEPQRRGR